MSRDVALALESRGMGRRTGSGRAWSGRSLLSGSANGGNGSGRNLAGIARMGGSSRRGFDQNGNGSGRDFDASFSSRNGSGGQRGGGGEPRVRGGGARRGTTYPPIPQQQTPRPRPPPPRGSKHSSWQDFQYDYGDQHGTTEEEYDEERGGGARTDEEAYGDDDEGSYSLSQEEGRRHSGGGGGGGGGQHSGMYSSSQLTPVGPEEEARAKGVGPYGGPNATALLRRESSNTSSSSYRGGRRRRRPTNDSDYDRQTQYTTDASDNEYLAYLKSGQDRNVSQIETYGGSGSTGRRSRGERYFAQSSDDDDDDDDDEEEDDEEEEGDSFVDSRVDSRVDGGNGAYGEEDDYGRSRDDEGGGSRSGSGRSRSDGSDGSGESSGYYDEDVDGRSDRGSIGIDGVKRGIGKNGSGRSGTSGSYFDEDVDGRSGRGSIGIDDVGRGSDIGSRSGGNGSGLSRSRSGSGRNNSNQSGLSIGIDDIESRRSGGRSGSNSGSNSGLSRSRSGSAKDSSSRSGLGSGLSQSRSSRSGRSGRSGLLSIEDVVKDPYGDSGGRLEYVVDNDDDRVSSASYDENDSDRRGRGSDGDSASYDDGERRRGRRSNRGDVESAAAYGQNDNDDGDGGGGGGDGGPDDERSGSYADGDGDDDDDGDDGDGYADKIGDAKDARDANASYYGDSAYGSSYFEAYNESYDINDRSDNVDFDCPESGDDDDDDERSERRSESGREAEEARVAGARTATRGEEKEEDEEEEKEENDTEKERERRFNDSWAVVEEGAVVSSTPSSPPAEPQPQPRPQSQAQPQTVSSGSDSAPPEAAAAATTTAAAAAAVAARRRRDDGSKDPRFSLTRAKSVVEHREPGDTAVWVRTSLVRAALPRRGGESASPGASPEGGGGSPSSPSSGGSPDDAAGPPPPAHASSTYAPRNPLMGILRSTSERFGGGGGGGGGGASGAAHVSFRNGGNDSSGGDGGNVVDAADRGDWGWVRGFIERDDGGSSGEDPAAATMTITICDETCPSLDGKTVTLNRVDALGEAEGGGTGDGDRTIGGSRGGVVMANAWEVRGSSATSSAQSSAAARPPLSKAPSQSRLRKRQIEREYSPHSFASSPSDNDTEDENDRREEEGPPSDLVQLPHLHEPSVVHSLRVRYASDVIYTNTGHSVLLAINPFKALEGLYGEDVMERYRIRYDDDPNSSSSSPSPPKRAKKKGKSPPPPPHIYGVAARAHSSMLRAFRSSSSSPPNDDDAKNANQSVLVSGDSGSGKTVSAKHVMGYLAAVSGSSDGGGGGGKKMRPSSSGGNVEDQVLASNPILESFGNARTVRNDNSSRFGKYIELSFRYRSSSSSAADRRPSDGGAAALLGASVETYLLERTRLIGPNPGERNYHVLYELLEGLETNPRDDDDDDARYFGLEGKTAKDFRMTTSVSGTYDRRDGVRDADGYRGLLRAMEAMNFDRDEVRSVFSVVSAILHASNVSFVETGPDASNVEEDDGGSYSLRSATSLLGVTVDDLRNALCRSRVSVGRGGREEVIFRNLSREGAERAMEALMKATYDALFHHLVRRINESIDASRRDDDDDSSGGGGGGSRPNAAAADGAIGVLDIFGFEVFATNSFEQLCINYCNEALQGLFNEHVLRSEQEEYEREGIEWSYLSYPENTDVLNLIESDSQGILALLSDQCRAPSSRNIDAAFASNLYERCSSNGRFSADARQRSRSLFCVEHYAGKVEYLASGFVEKNRDELREDLVDLLRYSEVSLVRTLAEVAAGRVEKRPQDEEDERPSSLSWPWRTARSSSASASTKPTVGSKFQRQLRALRAKISSTEPHYVRCLKPNDDLVPDDFDARSVAHQLRCAGVVEAVRISRLGYPHRFGHGAFVHRFWILDEDERGVVGCDGSVMTSGFTREERRSVSADKLLWRITERRPEFVDLAQLGRTKIFVRTDGFELLEKLRNAKVNRLATTIQAAWRRYIASHHYVTSLGAAVVIQSIMRVGVAKAHLRRAATERWAAETIALWCQRRHRGAAGRAEFHALKEEKRRAVASRAKPRAAARGAARAEEVRRSQNSEDALRRKLAENDRSASGRARSGERTNKNSEDALRMKLANARAEQEQRAKATARNGGARASAGGGGRRARLEGAKVRAAGATGRSTGGGAEESKAECEPIAGAMDGNPRYKTRSSSIEGSSAANSRGRPPPRGRPNRASTSADDRTAPRRGNRNRASTAPAPPSIQDSNAQGARQEDDDRDSYHDIESDLEAGQFGANKAGDNSPPSTRRNRYLGKYECVCMVALFIVGATLLTVGIVYAVIINK